MNWKSKIVPACAAFALMAAYQVNAQLTNNAYGGLQITGGMLYNSPTPGANSWSYILSHSYRPMGDMQAFLQQPTDGNPSACRQLDYHRLDWGIEDTSGLGTMLQNGQGLAMFVSSPPINANTLHADIRVYKSPASSAPFDIDELYSRNNFLTTAQHTSFVKTWKVPSGAHRIGIFTKRISDGFWEHQATYEATDASGSSNWTTAYKPAIYNTACGVGTFIFVPDGYIRFGNTPWYSMKSIGYRPVVPLATSFDFPSVKIESATEPTVPNVRILGARAQLIDRSVVITWGIDHQSSPQMSYDVSLTQAQTGSQVARTWGKTTAIDPNLRRVVIDYPLDADPKVPVFARVSLTNISDTAGTPVSVAVEMTSTPKLRKLKAWGSNNMLTVMPNSVAGSAVMMSQFGATSNLTWEMRPTAGPGQFELISNATKRCVEARVDRTLVEEPCNGTDAQIFYMMTTLENATNQLVVSKAFASHVVEQATADGTAPQSAAAVQEFNASLAGLNACLATTPFAQSYTPAALTICNASTTAALPASRTWSVMSATP